MTITQHVKDHQTYKLQWDKLQLKPIYGLDKKLG